MGDFWWHLNSGRWILENLSLPSDDPFTYTVPEGFTIRKTIILKGFWLAQAIYYSIYRLFDFTGLIIFKAALFTTLFYALWRTLKRKGLDSVLSLIFLTPVVILMDRFEEVRPQAFSFLLALLLLNCAEKTIETLREGSPLKTRQFVTPALIMLLWANIHRGFMVGYAVLGMLFLGETIKYLSKRNALSGESYRRFILWTFMASASSLLNPNHVYAIYENIRELASSSFVQIIDEYMAPWDYAAFFNIPNTLYGLAAFALATLIILVLSWRRLELSHALLYIGFASAALSAFRFCAFFIIMSAAISGGYLAALTLNLQKRIRPGAALVAIVCAILIFSFSYKRSFISKGAVETTYIPDAAVNFISTQSLPGPLFNPYEWGGYISWKLYPRHSVFVDSRALDPEVRGKYHKAKLGKKSEVFREYGIRTVMFYPVNPIINEVPGLIFSILKDRAWRLVYLDEKSSIFLRSGDAPSVPSLDKELLLSHLENLFLDWTVKEADNPKPYVQLGIIYHARENRDKSLEYLNKALSIYPEDQNAKAWIEYIRDGEN
jgi:uncharacterized membrane protein